MHVPMTPSNFAIPLPLLLVFAVAVGVQTALGGYTGLIVCALGVLALYWRSRRRQQRLLHWSAQLDSTPPAALRGYDELIANIYRQHRHLRKQTEQAHTVFDDWQTMLNALPFGVLRLDGELQLTWCNQNAERLLSLNLPEDLGFRLSNILRTPAFVSYASKQDDWQEGITLQLPAGQIQAQLVDDKQGGAVLLVFPQALEVGTIIDAPAPLADAVHPPLPPIATDTQVDTSNRVAA